MNSAINQDESGLHIHAVLTCSFFSHHPQAFSFILSLKCIQIKDTGKRQKREKVRADKTGNASVKCIDDNYPVLAFP